MKIFPDFLARHAKKLTSFDNQLVKANNGFEYCYQRSQRKNSVHYIENILCNYSQISAVLGFFEEMKGRRGKFLFKDYFHYKYERKIIGVSDGVSLEFNIKEPIIKNNATIFVDDVELKVDLKPDGLVMFDKAPANGAKIQASFEFYKIARFDQDNLIVSQKDNAYLIEKLCLAEITN